MHEDHRKRVKERFLKDGIENMPDHEVLELLLFFSIPRKDTNALAHELIEHFGSLNCVLEASADDLMQVNGIGGSLCDTYNTCFSADEKVSEKRIGQETEKIRRTRVCQRASDVKISRRAGRDGLYAVSRL